MIVRRFLSAFVFSLALNACAQPETTAQAPASAAPAAAANQYEQVVIDGRDGPVTFEVEVADDDAERAGGLMYRQTMPGYHGMLFDFQEPKPVSFWMHNTVLPLDIIFIGVDGRILNIAENTTPYSDASIPSAGVVRGVLEVGAGRAAALGVRPGDKVHHRIFPD